MEGHLVSVRGFGEWQLGREGLETHWNQWGEGREECWGPGSQGWGPGGRVGAVGLQVQLEVCVAPRGSHCRQDPLPEAVLAAQDVSVGTSGWAAPRSYVFPGFSSSIPYLLELSRILSDLLRTLCLWPTCSHLLGLSRSLFFSLAPVRD